jgi:nucleotide-binding universal stress UspA family protein
MMAASRRRAQWRATVTIVVGFVPTPEGEAAVDAAIEESRRRAEPLLVVNTTRGDAYVDQHFATETQIKDVRARLDGAGVSYDVVQRVRGREAAEEVVDAAVSSRASLIVIGIRRRTPTGKLLFGSQAQRILLDADCPVLAVKASG